MSPWIRLSDSYIDHPKFLALSDGAFRLWHEGMAFSRKHQTDGRIAASALQGFRYFRPARVTELIVQLWDSDGTDYVIHDYHDWNASRAEESARRHGTKERMQRWRHKPPSDTAGYASQETPRTSARDASSDAFVPERERDKAFRKKGPDEGVDDRAGRFLERYRELYSELRQGAKLVLVASPVDWQKASTLCQHWDDAHLEKLARIFLTTDEEWIAHTGREFSVFALKASWCDDRLRIWEAKQTQAARV